MANRLRLRCDDFQKWQSRGVMPVTFATRGGHANLQSPCGGGKDMKRPPKTFTWFHPFSMQAAMVSLIEKLAAVLLVVKPKIIKQFCARLQFPQIRGRFFNHPITESLVLVFRQENPAPAAAIGAFFLAGSRQFQIKIRLGNRVQAGWVNRAGQLFGFTGLPLRTSATKLPVT